MSDSSHLSIGEVLALVQADFPDVTISKIRFLESQGLLDPERTPSGYRKFHGVDIERLQWILGQQRDHFLPLKVIRERLDEWDATGTVPESAGPDGDTRAVSAPQMSAPSAADPTETPAPERESTPAPAPAPIESEAPVSRRDAASSLAAASAMEIIPSNPEPTPEVEPVAEAPAQVSPVPSSVASSGSGAAHGLGIESQVTAGELAERAGVSLEVVAELENYAMVESKRIGAETYYHASAVEVASACRAFLDQGIEVRHLRMYKIAAEREAGIVEQLIMPLLKQRNPEARARAVTMVDSLSTAGESLHAAMLRQVLRQSLP